MNRRQSCFLLLFLCDFVDMKRLILCLALFTAFFPFRAFAQKEADSALIDAVSLFSDGKWQEAIKALAQLSQKYPDNDAVYYYLGLSCCYAGEAGLGENYLREAFSRDSSNYWYQEYLARVCSINGKSEQTVSLYEDLLKKYPKKTDLHFALVDLYARSGDFSKVLEILDDIEKVRGTSEDVALYKYQVLMHLKRNAEAFEVLEKYNAQYSSERVLTAMGDSYLAQYNDTAALRFYSEALSYVPDFAPAILGRAETYRIKRAYPSFFAELTQYLSLEELPMPSKTQYFGDVLSRMDPKDIVDYRAQIDFAMDAFLDKAVLDSNALRLAGTWYFSTQRGDKALPLFEKNARTYPKSKDARLLFIEALMVEKQYDRILEESLKASEEFSSVPDFYNIIADTYHQLGKKREAFKYYEKALSVNPEYVQALNNYAYYLCEDKRKLKKAFEMSKVTIEKEPDNATYLDTYGWILHLMGRSAEAKSYFKHALLYGGKDNYEVLVHYSEVLEAVGEGEMAKLYRNMAAKIKPEQ